jgi:hypothetical protein
MAKSFPSAPTATIVHAQQVVSGPAIIAPSDSDRAKAHRKWSTTHGPSHKEVVVITSPPTHWPNKLVVGPLNSYLGSHGRAIRAVTETRNHLGGLALVCDILPVEADIQVMHAYFNAAAKTIPPRPGWRLARPNPSSASLTSCTLVPSSPTTPKANPSLSLHSRSRKASPCFQVEGHHSPIPRGYASPG